MRIVLVLAVISYLYNPALAQAQQARQSWARRLTLAASCAASLWDVQTTAAAISRGGRESNGLFSDPQGRPRWGRMIGLKAGLCGALVVAQESKLAGRRSQFKDNFWTGANAGLTTRFTVSAIRNNSVAGDLSRNPPAH